MTNTAVYELCGTNRGGRTHMDHLLRKTSPTRAGLQVQLIDRQPGRSQAMIPVLERAGENARAEERAAGTSSNAVARVLAVDDADVVSRILEQPVQGDLLEAGFLVAAPTLGSIGGAVMGLGVALTAEAEETRGQASSMADRIAFLAGQRRSSREMAASFLNSPQMAATRDGVHDQLTDVSTLFLERKPVSPGLFVVDGLSRQRFELAVAEAPSSARRRDLIGAVTHEIAPSLASAGCFGVAYVDRQDPWIMLVLARRTAGRWTPVRTVELPFTVPEPLMSTPTSILDEPRSTRRGLLVTD